MKVTAIPAQITTVEDRIAGNLGLTQLLLLCAPLFLSAFVYFLLPPFGHNGIYKLVIIGLSGLIFGALAIRLKSKLVIDWLSLLLRYQLRPRYYVYTKTNRLTIDQQLPAVTKKVNATKKHIIPQPNRILLSLSDLRRSQQLLSSSKHSIVFKTNKKGGLNVQISET